MLNENSGSEINSVSFGMATLHSIARLGPNLPCTILPSIREDLPGQTAPR